MFGYHAYHKDTQIHNVCSVTTDNYRYNIIYILIYIIIHNYTYRIPNIMHLYSIWSILKCIYCPIVFRGGGGWKPIRIKILNPLQFYRWRSYVSHRRKFRSQTSDSMDRWKVGRVREEKSKERRSEKRKSQKKEDAGARKGSKVAKHCVFPMICGPGGSKSRLAR